MGIRTTTKTIIETTKTVAVKNAVARDREVILVRVRYLHYHRKEVKRNTEVIAVGLPAVVLVEEHLPGETTSRKAIKKVAEIARTLDLDRRLLHATAEAARHLEM